MKTIEQTVISEQTDELSQKTQNLFKRLPFNGTHNYSQKRKKQKNLWN